SSRPPAERETPLEGRDPQSGRLVSATSTEGFSKARSEPAKSAEESAHLGSEDADRTHVPGAPTNREAFHASLTDLAATRDRGLEPRSLNRVVGRTVVLVVRVRKVAHPTTQARFDQS